MIEGQLLLFCSKGRGGGVEALMQGPLASIIVACSKGTTVEYGVFQQLLI